MKHISYPSIDHFKNLCSTVYKNSSFVGLDEEDKPIYDNSLQRPIIKFTGRIKLHGSNYSVCYNEFDGLWVQSRENVLSPIQDNAGSYFWTMARKEVWMNLIEQVYVKNNLSKDHTVSIYGEFVGKGVQKNVGISNLEKSVFIFGVKISDLKDEDSKAYWVDSSELKATLHQIYNIDDFKKYELEVDFNLPQLAQNQLVDYTIEVENECPVTKALLSEHPDYGDMCKIGEGIVWTGFNAGKKYIMKSKGELHSKSKVKTVKRVDDAKIQLALDVTDKVTPEWRLEQMLSETFDLLNNGQLDRKRMGDYIRAVNNDIVKEDIDVIIESGLTLKDVSKYISDVAKSYFFTKEAEFLGMSVDDKIK